MAVPPPESPSRTAAELATQPACWRRAADAAPVTDGLPRTGERVAITGCGTSWFMAQAYASLREAAGEGETDAFAASEFPTARRYDRVVAITRSGTTTEVLDLLAALRGTAPLLALTADPATPVRDAADALAVLDWADEESVVQTRFATTALALLRSALPGGTEAVLRAADEAAGAVGEPLPDALLSASQWTFLGRGWAYGVAQEAALKMREAAGAWTEAYPAMEYRHGPVAIAGPGRVTWAFGPVPEGLEGAVGAAGGTFVHTPSDPLAELVRAQRVAVAVAEARGLDPDRPRGLTRSVVLGA
ncbi:MULTISPECIES: SIS domain-containing protein [Streptomyces]|uniref:SIS domain-containing protein n=1 Tax=Streptomyces TaxID=1883 RepID=UPI00163BE172|nr:MULTISPECIES: sugar isomerase [Streptomyces]MBC2874927.1 sugar isomerase [Streptomyces sp. TYQ1024]UBI37368.1 sugar isomerase [Streptomyces mobaraensis]UKW29960.1 sugar isomerase [Streptomyces sp. TYQ1024]